jgi:hypothetical protein
MCNSAWGQPGGLEHVAEMVAAVGLSVAMVGFVPFLGGLLLTFWTDSDWSDRLFSLGVVVAGAGIVLGVGGFTLHLWSCLL